MKKRTRKQQYSDYADTVKAMKEGKPVKRSRAKDGSVATHPIVELNYPNLSEKVVLHLCRMWLQQHHIFHDRHDAGTFQNERGQWGTYGIKGAGDIIGLLPTGQHFEIEVKRGKGGRLSLGQQKRMRDIRTNNGYYFVCHGVEELEYYFKDLI